MILKSQIPITKSQLISNYSISNWILVIGILLVIGHWLLVIDFAYAKEITIIYTGETHAMLYPCNCPKESDGGIARRATLIKQIRKKEPYTLLLDTGGFFAGGLTDEYTQNTQLDMERTKINLSAMEIMRYDALAVGDDEFNFGREFLEENIAKTKIPFLSCNIESDPEKSDSLRRSSGSRSITSMSYNIRENIKPYLIKEIRGTKIGIIGVTGLFAAQKAGGLKFIEPKVAVKKSIEELKKLKVDIIILFSHQGENEDLKLIKDIPQIDILIVGHNRAKEEPSSKIDSTLVLRPAWQGRKLGRLSLVLKDNKIADYKVQEIRLSDKISDDPKVLSILPQCFSDINCRQKGLIGTCQEPATTKARCEFNKVTKVSLLIITPGACISCNPERMINTLKGYFPGLVISYLYYPDTQASKLIKDFGIKGLPVYLLGKEIEKEKAFDSLKENLEAKGNFYMLKPQFSGIAYFLNRQKIKGKLDLFISLYNKDTPKILEAIREFKPTVHFLTVQQQDNFDAQGGNLEVQECLRSVCVQKYYPQIFWDYISCRAKNISSSWWEDCLNKLDASEIRTCAKGDEGKILLKDNIQLNKELEVMFGPAYLLDNQEIFGTGGVPTKEDFKKIFRRR